MGELSNEGLCCSLEHLDVVNDEVQSAASPRERWRELGEDAEQEDVARLWSRNEVKVCGQEITSSPAYCV